MSTTHEPNGQPSTQQGQHGNGVNGHNGVNGNGHVTIPSGDGYPRPPWVLEPAPGQKPSLAVVTDKVSAVTEKPMPAWWWPAFALASTMLLGGFGAATYLISTGIGVWGEQIPVCWAFDITNFVFWIGIGHAGTLISAILFLFRQKWRTSINRFSEAMTLFAVLCAAVYPVIHTGRVWYAVWWLPPIPTSNHIWPNFKSPLMWDVFAISTYGTVSLLFWYTGLIPDLATLRDRARPGSLRQKILGLMSFGWRGANRHWGHFEVAYLTLAGISTPLVLSVHSIVSFDFAVSLLPGWHTTIFPPYFVAGAIFGGFAMVLQCMIPAREMFNMRDLVTDRHLEVMAKIVLATGTLVGYAYIMEFFIAWYSGVPAEQETFYNRMFGEYWWAYWTMMTCNLIIPQIFWFKKCRTTPWIIFLVAVAVNVGMWFERFVIIVTSLYRNPWVPSSYGQFVPTWVDWLLMIGDFGLFFTLTLIFIRLLPMIAMFEVKPLVPGAKLKHHYHGENGEPLPKLPPAERGLFNGGVYSQPTPLLPNGAQCYAAIGMFDGPNELKQAVVAAREAGFTKLEVYTPYPVHGMLKAQGLRRSIMPWISLAGGITGFFTALTMQYYLAYIDYPIVVGGKLYTSWEPCVPICFELMVLFTAFATVGGMLLLSGLPRYYHPVFRSDAFARATDDRFFLVIEARDPKFSLTETPAFLQKLGSTHVELIEK
jgi:Ni/Fe-hydrogenase subunit HybB-like protein